MAVTAIADISTVGVSITGTGLWAPADVVSNAELVESLTVASTRFNEEHAAEIEAGSLAARPLPNEEFIVKASGIKSRHVVDKVGVLDPDRMRPHLDARTEDQLGVQAEMAMPAIEQALAQAGRTGADVDAVIVGCSNLQRAYPAVAIEIQDALGASGWAYDMNVACSSATFSIQAAVDALRNGSASCVVVVNPEITSGHNNFELRDFHFIFGDACTALVLERSADAVADDVWTIIGTKLATQFSNNIRNDFGFLNSSEDGGREAHELVFRQNGQKVFREVCPMVAAHITVAPRGMRVRAGRRPALLAAPGQPEDEPADRQGRARPAPRPTTRRRPSSTSTPTPVRPVRSSPSTSTAPISLPAISG